jgi:hypothetical protein
MTTVKRITDLTDYTGVLPYASEMFGIYQPLLGWKSKRIAQRFTDGYRNDRAALLDKLERARRYLKHVSDVRLRSSASGLRSTTGFHSSCRKRFSPTSIPLKRLRAASPSPTRQRRFPWSPDSERMNYRSGC